MSDKQNLLYYGDNLDVLRERIEAESVDLIYLDPPFNSNRSYNVLFGNTHGEDARAQIEAFDDTWTWTPETEQLYVEMLSGGAPGRVADALQAMHGLLGEGEVMAYLAMMAARLVELHRVLKPTGSIYLHCDPTASHYLKVLMDAIFGTANFRNEIIWKRTNARSTDQRWPRIHDTLLFCSKGSSFKFKPTIVPADKAKLPHTLITGPDGQKYQTFELTGAGVTKEGESGKPWRGFDPSAFGRHWAASASTLDEWDAGGLIHWPKPGSAGGFPRRRAEEPFDEEARTITVGDVWTDIDRINQSAKERLGYPTQKPQALLERIIFASSNEGDVVLDPFCGCGTTLAAAEVLGRRWVGIDVTYIAIDLVRRRMEDTFGEKLDYELHGIPRDLAGARALFKESPFDFERWAVSLVNGQPNEKQVGDKGIDGVIRFPLDAKTAVGRCIVSVKGGGQVNPAMVRDLGGTITNHKAEMGVLITMDKATPGMIDAANHGGNYTWPVNEATFPRVQLVTVAQLLRGEQPNLPPVLTPYLKATRQTVKTDQLTLGR